MGKFVSKKKGRYKPAEERDYLAEPTVPFATLTVAEPDLDSIRETIGVLGNQVRISNATAWEKIRAVAWSQHPKYKLPRVIVALLRLEEMAYAGDMDAMKLYFDRVLGKQADGLAVTVGAFDNMSNADMLSSISKLANVAQSPSKPEDDVKEETL